jgi:hypothetical protein
MNKEGLLMKQQKTEKERRHLRKGHNKTRKK